MYKEDSLPVLTVKLISSWSWHRPFTFEVQSMKLEMNYSAHQERDDWRLRRFVYTPVKALIPNCVTFCGFLGIAELTIRSMQIFFNYFEEC